MSKRKKRSNQPSQVPPLDDRHYLAMELIIGVWVNGRRQKLNRTQIARECGVSRMQLYRWEQRKDFQKELDKRRKRRLKEMFPRRNNTLVKQALNGDITAAIRILEANRLLG